MHMKDKLIILQGKVSLAKKMVITGGPKPINRLKDKKEQSTLTRLGRKSLNSVKGPFTLEGEGSYSPLDPPPLKKQKLNPEKQEQGKISFSDNIKDEIDGIRTESINTQSLPASIIRKPVRSIGYPQYSIPLSGGVDEFQRVEAIMGFDKFLKNTVQKRAQSLQTQNGPAPNSSMRPSTDRRVFDPSSPPNPVILDDDSIEEVSPQPKQRYGGTATRSFSRQKGNINSDEVKIDLEFTQATGEKSRFFPVGLKNRLGPVQIVPSGESDSLETPKVYTKASPSERKGVGGTSSDDDGLDPLNPDHFLSQGFNNRKTRVESTKNTLRKHPATKSASISKHGDVRPSIFVGLQVSKSRRKTARNLVSNAVFNVAHIFDGSAVLSSDHQLLQFRLNQETKDFDIIVGGNPVSDLYPTMVVKPKKIHKVWFSKESNKVIIFRATEQNIRSAQKLFIRMKETKDGEIFRGVMVQMNSLIKLEELSRDHLYQVFEKQSEEAKKAPKRSLMSTRSLEPLAGKEAHKVMAQIANTVAERDVLEVAETADSQQQQNVITDDDVLKSQESKPPLVDKSAATSLIEPSRVYSGDSLQLTPGTEPSGLLEEDNERSTFMSKNHLETRSSSRFQNLDVVMDQQVANTPLGWTRRNPGWQAKQGWTSALVYPAEGPKKATVDAVDIDRLDEGEYLNDNLIEFYLRYLEHNLGKNNPEVAKRIYFQNTFFYQTLTKGKMRGNSINYEAVKRWTTKVDIFSFDYIIVPVCEKAHWYVAIICNAPRLLQTHKGKNDESEVDARDEEDPAPDLGIHKTRLETSKPHITQVEYPESKQTINRAKGRSRSPSVTAKVKHLSLDEGSDDKGWPESDDHPETLSMATTQSRHDEPINSDELPSESPRYEAERSLPPSGMMENLFKGRKGKRKSIPPSRTYDPSQPRIITLDSLGGSHSPTCSNLQKYLVCEAMAKRRVNISIERLGMTAKGLPLQDNFCDCGIFVLGYIEEFLKDPDLFVHDILLGNMTTERGWTKFNAPEMRTSIRELLLKLHDEQNKRDTQLRTAKFKAKRQYRLGMIDDLGQSTDSGTHAASKTLPTTPALVIPEGSEAMEPMVKTENDKDDIEQEKVGHFAWNNTTSATKVVKPLLVDEELPCERKMTKRSRSDVEESESPRSSVQDGLTKIRRASFEIGPVDISDIPSPQFQQSSPRLGTPLIPKGRFITSKWLASEASATSNIFKQYAKTKPRSVDHKTFHGVQLADMSQDDCVVIRSPSDEAPELLPNSRQIVDALEEVLDSAKAPSKRIRTETFLEDVATDFLSTTTNSAGRKPLLSSSPRTLTRASPRITRTSPRIHPARKYISQDRVGQFLSRKERQAQGTWAQKRRELG